MSVPLSVQGGLNGEFVHSGRFPDVPPQGYYDVLPIKTVRSMEAEWSRMLDAGATSFWEMREGWPAFDNAGSLCHGWSAVPVYVYGTYPDLVRERD